MKTHHRHAVALAALATLALAAPLTQASSHREAPFISTAPKVDASDFYMFRSYEPGRSEHVTLIANYVPLQDAYGGPNYFALDANALYEIHIDNNGDAKEDLSFQFRFRNTLAGNGAGTNLMIGGKAVNIPLIQTLLSTTTPGSRARIGNQLSSASRSSSFSGVSPACAAAAAVSSIVLRSRSA